MALIIEFACAPLVTPYRQEAPDWMRFEYFRIDAISPEGTTVDGAREMLRKALAERLGFAYHVAARETPVYHLVRSSGPLRLLPSTEPDSQEGTHRSPWLFKERSATLATFARFLSNFAGREVLDKTGIEGSYQFDLDWTQELQEDSRNDGPSVASAGARKLGLKLEANHESRKILVVDRANQRPTAN